MLTTTSPKGTCPCKLQPAQVLIYMVGARLLGVDVGCVSCGLPGRVLPDDMQHGAQAMQISDGRLVQMEPGFTCRDCGVRQAVHSGRLEVTA